MRGCPWGANMRRFPAFAGFPSDNRICISPLIFSRVCGSYPNMAATASNIPVNPAFAGVILYHRYRKLCRSAPALAVVILTVRTVWRASLLPRVCGGYPYPAIIRDIGGENRNSRVYGSYPCSAELKLLIPLMRELSIVLMLHGR